MHNKKGEDWNYLRVRGEYSTGVSSILPLGELPPRARRIRWSIQYSPVSQGTTSACAENTVVDPVLAGFPGNYLRVRGEYEHIGGLADLKLELPPRARRIHVLDALAAGTFGTTSACAENTSVSGSPLIWCRNYLRVRGEYRSLAANIRLCMELPPRARRIPFDICSDLADAGTTSACAENTHSACEG